MEQSPYQAQIHLGDGIVIWQSVPLEPPGPGGVTNSERISFPVIDIPADRLLNTSAQLFVMPDRPNEVQIISLVALAPEHYMEYREARVAERLAAAFEQVEEAE